MATPQGLLGGLDFACWFAALIGFCHYITGSAAHVAPVIRILLAFPKGFRGSSGILCGNSGGAAELL